MASDLDQQQIIQQVYDESENRLRVDAQISTSIIAPPGLEVAIAAVDDNIAIRNSTNSNELLINADGSINSNVLTSALPTGAATSANQTTGNASLSSINSKLVDLNTTPVQTVQLFTRAYDAIAATYPSTTQEVYQSYVGGLSGTLQQTVTVNYTDITKNFILNIART